MSTYPNESLNSENLNSNKTKKPFGKILSLIILLVIIIGVVSCNYYKNRTDISEKDTTNISEPEVVIPTMGKIIENPDGSKIGLGIVKDLEETTIYFEVNDSILPIKTDKNTMYLVNYHEIGKPEKGSFEDIEINDVLSILFKKMEDGNFVSISVLINK